MSEYLVREFDPVRDGMTPGSERARDRAEAFIIARDMLNAGRCPVIIPEEECE